MAYRFVGNIRTPAVQHTILAWSVKPQATNFPEFIKNAALISVLGLFVMAGVASLDVSSAFLMPVTAALLIGLMLNPLLTFLSLGFWMWL